MPDENTTETTRSEAPRGDESPIADAPVNAAAPAVEAEENSGAPDDAPNESALSTELKVVVSIKGGRATIGVQQPPSDPHIESFDDPDLTGLTQEVPAVTERARAKWEEAPRHAAYVRPAPPVRRRSRRQQGPTQDTTAGAEAEQAQQQTLKLF